MAALLSLFSLLFANSVIIHDVESTRIINNGTYRIETIGLSQTEVRVTIHYELHKQWYAPISDQVGDLVQDLPIEYTREEGYLDLEHKGQDRFQNVVLYHLGRVNIGKFSNCHKIQVVKQDGSWEAVAFYHPSVTSTGWTHMELTLKKIPVLGDYTLVSNLRL